MVPLLLQLAASAALLPAQHSALAATITSTTRQTIHGIGASGAWWTNDLSLFPAGVRANVSALLFSADTGIGFTSYRYNLGGGGVGVGTWARAPETPYVSDGVYNFSADAAGTYFLRQAAAYDIPVITLFVNSAPTTFTSNGQNCGGSLITARIPAYAKYLADVVAYWKTQKVTITHVSPMNEPDNNFDDGDPTTLCGQEGMQVYPNQRAQVVEALASAFRAANLTTAVIADESSSTGTFFEDAPTWITPTVGKLLGGVAHHQYGFANATVQTELGTVARNLSGGVSSWFTEICCFAEVNASQANDPLAMVTWAQKYDPTIVGGLRMANLVQQSFENAEDAHWDWWTALSSGYGCDPTIAGCATSANYEGWDDGLIYYNPDYANSSDYSITLTKRATVLRHYTRAVPVGAVRRAVSGVPASWRILAFDRPGGGGLNSIVAFYGANGSSTLALTPSQGVHVGSVRSAVVTTQDEDWTPAKLQQRSGEISVQANGPSIFTLFF